MIRIIMDTPTHPPSAFLCATCANAQILTGYSGNTDVRCERMGTDEAKQIYKDRAASIECANAHLRNRGLQRFNVRGLSKARAVLLWHALAHNLKRMMAMNFAFAA